MASISSRMIRWILLKRSLREKQVVVDAGGKLADVAGAQQQLVADDFGFGGVLPQRGDEKLAPTHMKMRAWACLKGKPNSSMLKWPFDLMKIAIAADHAGFA